MSIVIIFAVLSGALQFSGYWFYVHKVLEKNIQPNTASWSIWAFGVNNNISALEQNI